MELKDVISYTDQWDLGIALDTSTRRGEQLPWNEVGVGRGAESACSDLEVTG